jgi:farnesyl-diphosphate farnesyltransferase
VHRLRIVKFDPNQSLGSPQADLDFQAAILPGVSRTFALTIPVLPNGLAAVVANAYLLCRIADTIEDDSSLDDGAKTEFHNRLVAVVRGEADAESFAQALSPLLSEKTLAAERELIVNTAKVIRVTGSFSSNDRHAVIRCLSRMCAGMPEFQRHRSLGGLADLYDMSAYCYVVAGVVGEMLTELFCSHCPALASKRPELMRLALSFGQGLQMTNILKDVWEDRRADTCWLPRCVFGNSFDLTRLDELYTTTEYRHGIEQLTGIAHHHLRNALEYALHIPASEPGIRRFCLWAIGLAVLTLRKVQKHCDCQRGDRVKISRRSVRAVVLAVNLACRSDRASRALFDLAGAGLPLVPGDSFDGFNTPLVRRQPDASRA